MSEKSIAPLQKYDSNMSTDTRIEDGLEWHSPLKAPFKLSGFPWIATDGIYRRMPVAPVKPLPEAVDFLANHTAGGQIRFKTNSRKLYLDVKLSPDETMYHMAPTGQRGFDCYLGKPGEMKFVNVTRFKPGDLEFQSLLIEWNNDEVKEVTINFPLYQGVQEVNVGLEIGAEISAPTPYLTEQPIVIYGTSITQGGCATRPGMAYTNILSRAINLEFINLGFSGSGKGEPEVAEVIAGIENPLCLVLDYEANCVSLDLLKQTMPEFIRIYREAHPDVPILVISRIQTPAEDHDPTLKQTFHDRREFQRSFVKELNEHGDERIHFCNGYLMFGDRYTETTVDGTHPTDLGFMLMAEHLTPVLKRLLNL